MKTDLAPPRTLIVVPGLTGPFSSSHKPVYELLIQEAQKRGYSHAVPAVLPGQAAADGTRLGHLSFSAAVSKVQELVLGQLSRNYDVRLCGISFGCGVAISVVLNKEIEAQKHRMSLRPWAPIPLWQSWDAFWRGPKSEQLGRETVFCEHREFYTGLEPLEVMLPNIQIPTKVCMGTCDEYNPPAWLDYLSALCARAKSNTAVEVLSPLPECHHNVTATKSAGFSAYLDFMLN